MECKLKLRIYTVTHQVFGDSTQTVFTDEKIRNYDNYEKIKSDILKLADLTRKATKENQEFSISLEVGNFTIATYYSYVSKINTHLTKGYSQSYKDWETILKLVNKKSAEIDKPKFDEKRILTDLNYCLTCLKEFASKNKDKNFHLKNPVSNNWNGQIDGFYFNSKGKILVNCYWQGLKTDGMKFVELPIPIKDISIQASEMSMNGSRTFNVNFSVDEIWEGIKNLLLQ